MNKSEPCFLFGSNEPNNEYKCLSQTFEYTLATDYEYSSFEVECQLLQYDNSLIDLINFDLQRLCINFFYI